MGKALLNTGSAQVFNFQAGKENEPQNGRYCYPLTGSEQTFFRGAEFNLPASAVTGVDFVTGQCVAVDADGITLKLATPTDKMTWMISRGTDYNDATQKVSLPDLNDLIILSLNCIEGGVMPAMGAELTAVDGVLTLTSAAGVGAVPQYEVQMINFQFEHGFGKEVAAKYVVIKRTK